MTKESMSERFDEELNTFIHQSNCTCCNKMGSGHSMAYLETETIKDFLRKELADQKARAIEIVRKGYITQCLGSEDHSENCSGYCKVAPVDHEAIATVLEEKL